MNRQTWHAVGAVLWLAFAATGSAAAAEPILTVTGLVADGPREFTLEDLQQMGQSEIQTSTPWTDGTQTFTGVSGTRFVEALQASGTEVVAKAINDYSVVIPFEVLDSDSLLIAYALNGAPMSVREKGPVWLVFPYDSDALFLSDTYRNYSAWNLSHLEFR